MFRWYEGSAVCYVYLKDFEWGEEEKEDLKNGARGTDGVSSLCYVFYSDRDSSLDCVRHQQDWVERFWRCRWFNRAWTLQELLAPQKIEFLDKHWIKFSTFVDQDTLQSAIEVRTRIPSVILRKEKDLRDINIATRMSWAAGREATKPEDIAYALLGIFECNMPLVYGEGRVKAFGRLQKEIMTESNDESLFAWSAEGFGFGMMAQSPDQFEDCSEAKPLNLFTPPWILTNAGLQISLCMNSLCGSSSRSYVVYLNCINPRSGLCPSFELYPTSDKQHKRSGVLSWKPFPITSAQSLRNEVIVHQSKMQSVPPIKFDWSSAVDFLTWSQGVPSHGWSVDLDHGICRRPAHQANEYIAMIQLKDNEEPEPNSHAIAAAIKWDEPVGQWKCDVTAFGQEKIGHALPTKSHESVCTYRTPSGYNIIASMPRMVPWNHEGPVCVRVSARMGDGGEEMDRTEETKDATGISEGDEDVVARELQKRYRAFASRATD